MRTQSIQSNYRKDGSTLMPIGKRAWSKKKNTMLEITGIHNTSEHLMLKELQEALSELSLIEQGKLAARPVAELMDAL